MMSLGKALVAAIISTLFVSQAFAFFGESYIVKGDTLDYTSLSEVISGLEPGTVLVMGEYHTSVASHMNQSTMLRRLADFEKKTSVGMEFFDYVDQVYIDQFMAGVLEEEPFLKAIEWSGMGYPFAFYRKQVLSPRRTGGTTIGLNMPRPITSKIVRTGLESLTDEEKALFPPDFSLGRESYKERFLEVVKEQHGGMDLPEDYLHGFWISQSLWDDTMAWNAVEFMKNNPEQILVIIVGNFHGDYMDGLPSRIRARGHDKVVTMTQELLFDRTKDEMREAIAPSEKYGPHADYIWVSEEPSESDNINVAKLVMAKFHYEKEIEAKAAEIKAQIEAEKEAKEQDKEQAAEEPDQADGGHQLQ